MAVFNKLPISFQVAHSVPGPYPITYATPSILAVLLCVTMAHADASMTSQSNDASLVFEPRIITESRGRGNRADEQSNIKWGGIPQDSRKPFNTDTSYSDSSLRPFYDFANNFIDTVQPNEFPYDIAEGMNDDDDYVSEHSNEISDYMFGFFFCVALGLLFAILMPIFGIIVCCCRSSGKCDGEMVHQDEDNKNVYRNALTLGLVLSTIMLGVSMILVCVTNDRIHAGVEEVEVKIHSNLNDLVTYIDNTVQEVEYVAQSNYNFTRRVIKRDMQNVDVLMGVPVRDELDSAHSITTTLYNVLHLTQEIESVNTAMLSIRSYMDLLEMNGRILAEELAESQDEIQGYLALPSCVGCDVIDATQLAMNVNFSQLPSISEEMALLESVRSRNLEDTIEEAMNDFDAIPWLVQNHSQPTVDSVDTLLDDFYRTITREINRLQDMPLDVKVEVLDLQKRMDDYHDDVHYYNQYRWGIGVALATIVCIIVLLQTCGLVFGRLSYDRKALPTERSCPSHCGGQMLIAAAVFIFTFSWSLMLLCTASLLVGGNLEKLVCEPILDPDYTVISKLFDSNDSILGGKGEYYVGKVILDNGSIPLTLSGLLEGCKENGPAYHVLKLDSQFDLDTIVNYSQSIDLETEIESMSVDFSNFVLLTPNLKKQLMDFSNATQIDYDTFIFELSKETTVTDLGDFADLLGTASITSSYPAKSKLNAASRNVDGVYHGIYTTVTDDQAMLLQQINDLRTATQDIPDRISAILQEIEDLEDHVKAMSSEVVHQEATTFAERILGIVDSYSSQSENLITNEIGRCQPIWDLYHSLFQNSVCKYTVDALNGFWLALSWCLVFMLPSVIFSIRLAKYFRRMRYLENYNHVGISTPGPAISGLNGNPATTQAETKLSNAPMKTNDLHHVATDSYQPSNKSASIYSNTHVTSSMPPMTSYNNHLTSSHSAMTSQASQSIPMTSFAPPSHPPPLPPHQHSYNSLDRPVARQRDYRVTKDDHIVTKQALLRRSTERRSFRVPSRKGSLRRSNSHESNLDIYDRNTDRQDSFAAFHNPAFQNDNFPLPPPPLSDLPTTSTDRRPVVDYQDINVYTLPPPANTKYEHIYPNVGQYNSLSLDSAITSFAHPYSIPATAQPPYATTTQYSVAQFASDDMPIYSVVNKNKNGGSSPAHAFSGVEKQNGDQGISGKTETEKKNVQPLKSILKHNKVKFDLDKQLENE